MQERVKKSQTAAVTQGRGDGSTRCCLQFWLKGRRRTQKAGRGRGCVVSEDEPVSRLSATSWARTVRSQSPGSAPGPCTAAPPLYAACSGLQPHAGDSRAPGTVRQALHYRPPGTYRIARLKTASRSLYVCSEGVKSLNLKLDYYCLMCIIIEYLSLKTQITFTHTIIASRPRHVLGHSAYADSPDSLPGDLD